MIQTAHRLNSVQEYYFSKKMREVRQLVAEGKPIINMGIGSPDLAPDASVIQAMVQGMNDAKLTNTKVIKGYRSCDKGWPISIPNSLA